MEELPKEEGVAAPSYVFDFDHVDCLLVKIALSAEGGVEAAERNLSAEIPGWDFESVRSAARARWNDVLSLAEIEGSSDQKKNWHTALYHLFVQPNNIADVGEKPFYSTFSTWDTFRAAHPPRLHRTHIRRPPASSAPAIPSARPVARFVRPCAL